jgi:hypothetical protein
VNQTVDLEARGMPSEFLMGQMTLLMAYYNFLCPHRALKFGTTLRTPAMQAGLANRRLSFREVFTSQAVFFLLVLIAETPCLLAPRIWKIPWNENSLNGNLTDLLYCH